MWLEKLVLVYLLTLFNSLDGYFLDNNLQNTGRHRRKGNIVVYFLSISGISTNTGTFYFYDILQSNINRN